MKWFPELRAVAFLRRIARAEERQADALEALKYVALHEAGLDRKQPKLVEIGTFDVEAANKRWQQAQEAKAAGVDE